ncbi:hypothetical protein V3C99_002002, partial [Haemonchus contortus]
YIIPLEAVASMGVLRRGTKAHYTESLPQFITSKGVSQDVSTTMHFNSHQAVRLGANRDNRQLPPTPAMRFQLRSTSIEPRAKLGALLEDRRMVEQQSLKGCNGGVDAHYLGVPDSRCLDLELHHLGAKR